MKASPIVSVIIPTYNRAHLVGRAIQSVLNQTFQDFELLVVDDSSSDQTEDVVCAFHDPRIKYLQRQENKGAPAARNAGINAASGDYLAFLDSDDEWLPEKLEKQLEVFRAATGSDLSLVSCRRWLIWPDGREHEVPVHTPRPSRLDILYHRRSASGIVSTCAFLIRRQPDAPLLFDETLPALQDWDFLLRATERGQIDCVLDPLVVAYREIGDHIHSPQNIYRARKILVGKYFDELAANPKELAAEYHRIAILAKRIGRRSECAYSMIRSIGTWPYDWRMYLRFVALFVGAWPRHGRHRV